MMNDEEFSSFEDLQGDFFTGSAPKVLSVGDGKIPTKKGRFELKAL